MLAVLHFLSKSACPDDTLNPLFSGGHFDMALMYTFGLNFDKTSTWIDKLWTALGSSNIVTVKSITSQLSLFIDRLCAESKNKMKVCQLIYEAQWVDKAKEVFSHIAPNGKLRIVDVTMTAIDILAVDFVCTCAGPLSSITLYRVSADDTFVKVLMSSLCKHNLDTLQELNLSENSIGDAGAEAMAAMLTHSTRLQTLNIAENSIGAAGAKNMAGMLQTNSSLQTLNIAGNRIGAPGAEAIATMLRHNTSLQTLNIHSTRIGDAGAKTMAAMLTHNSSLQTLNLHCNSIGDAGAVAMADMLRQKMCLQTLDISFNSIGAAGAEAMAIGLYENTLLTELDIRGNKIGPDGRKALTDVRKHRLTVTIRV